MAYLPPEPESGFQLEFHAEFDNPDQPSQSLWTRGVMPTSFHMRETLALEWLEADVSPKIRQRAVWSPLSVSRALRDAR